MNKLLLLHGALGSSKQLLPLSEALRNDFEIYLLDFKGHGGSDIPDESFSISMFSQDIKELIEKHKLENINIFGYSMGGYAALYLARHYPGLVGKIFTLATKFNWNEETSKMEVKMLDADKIAEKVPKFAEELKQRHAPASWKIVLQKTGEMMMNLGKDNELKEEDFEEINNSVLVGVGDKDNMVTIEETVEAYKKLPNSSLIIMPGVQHPIEKVDVKRLAAEIKLFFS